MPIIATKETSYRRGRAAGRTGVLIACNPFSAREAQIDWLQGYGADPSDQAQAKLAKARIRRLKDERTSR